MDSIDKFLKSIASDVLNKVYSKLKAKLQNCDFWNFVEISIDDDSDSVHLFDRGSCEILPGVSLEVSLEIRVPSENVESYLNEEENKVIGYITLHPVDDFWFNGFFEANFEYFLDNDYVSISNFNYET